MPIKIAQNKSVSQNTTIIIYCRQKSSRLEYAACLLFEKILTIPYEITQDTSVYSAFDGLKINYSSQEILSNEVWISPHPLIFETGIHTLKINFTLVNDLKAAFFTQKVNATLPFDPFALTFFLASRYEEYNRPGTHYDIHNRFISKYSYAAQFDFIDQPLINQWAIELKRLLQERFPASHFPEKKYSYQPTYDIDIAWAYKNRSLVRHLVSGGKQLLSGQLKHFLHRLKVIQGVQNDPFDTYAFLDELHKKYKLHPQYFFLLAKRGKYDKAISPQNPQLQSLIKQMSELHEVDIHPSYASHKSTNTLKAEIELLQSITNKPIHKSRQHFLKLEFPTTYQNLIQMGIQKDYSMGYADQIGFRASLASPFPWYDLPSESITSLIIHPFQVMDATLKNYMKIPAEKVVATVLPLINAVRKVDGTFTTLWHNSSFSYIDGWEKYQPIYEKIIEAAI
ncbi:MAG: polysaccharide deacetylase family protein [Bacteroidota bacterium]